VGIAGWCAGLPLWIVGQKKVNNAWERYESTAMIPKINLALSPEYRGLSARWRF